VAITQLSPAAYTARFAQDDTAELTPGAYDAELLVVDSSEAGPVNACKFAVGGTVHVLPAMGGNIGL